MEEIKLSKILLDQIINEESRKLVGKIMKRYEIIEDKNTLKLELKELIYENFRNVRDIIVHCSKNEHDIVLINKK